MSVELYCCTRYFYDFVVFHFYYQLKVTDDG
jgi:hypothetical protein